MGRRLCFYSPSWGRPVPNIPIRFLISKGGCHDCYLDHRIAHSYCWDYFYGNHPVLSSLRRLRDRSTHSKIPVRDTIAESRLPTSLLYGYVFCAFLRGYTQIAKQKTDLRSIFSISNERMTIFPYRGRGDPPLPPICRIEANLCSILQMGDFDGGKNQIHGAFPLGWCRIQMEVTTCNKCVSTPS